MSNLQIGKLYTHHHENALLALTETQYNTNYVFNLIRLKKLQALNSKTVTGSDFVVLNKNSVVIPLSVDHRTFAGEKYILYKALFEDKFIYIPMSSKSTWEEYFLLLTI